MLFNYDMVHTKKEKNEGRSSKKKQWKKSYNHSFFHNLMF
jgi:hypothetical protein